MLLEGTYPFTPLEIMPRCSAAGLSPRIIPAGFNAPLEFLTGFTLLGQNDRMGPPVLVPSVFIMSRIQWPLFSIADGRDTV